MSQPNIDALWMQIYGGYGLDLGAINAGWLNTASGIVVGSNPPYTLADFVAFYPKFGEVKDEIFTGTVPAAAINMYIALASASLMQGRWREAWTMVMGLYVAHYCTLYLRSEGSAGTTAGAIAASGLEKGITISQSAGDVSKSSQLVQGFEQWGAFAQTTYGTQLITLAKTVGRGPIFVR